MIRFIHSNPRFEKRLNELRRSERFAVAAAKRANKIIANLIQMGSASIIETGRLSRHGEARIPNCVKYDLGKGYRLISVKKGEHFFLLYIGTHDDCHKWIEDNRGLIPAIHKNDDMTRVVNNTISPEHREEQENEQELDYDDILMAKITEKDLRYVFSGLFRKSSLAKDSSL
ncbi:conserved hypothetical protein [uncultured Desulfobacterium sp.]|uniref:Uncharacterized protein n=1 Tax=uncultured Desulfobacterium sp. TaxID=201089 RepID=A0A445N0S3_9BACT|nr:conserved hypothetical protein [uncultured Desulfobacterium sp.]